MRPISGQEVLPVELTSLLTEAVERNASDVHLRPDARPSLRVDGRLRTVEADPVPAGELERQTIAMMPAARAVEFETTGETDFAYEAAGVGRFRVNAFRHQGRVGLVMRLVREQVPAIDELGLPPVVRRIATESRGLVLVTGRIGTGKTTTVAAMIDQINETRDGHILTIEDPVEYRHRDKRCLVTQRDVGIDTEGFRPALKRALRQDPDVIFIGEMRDAETMWAALSAAETGHLVLATLHTANATESVNRILDFFPPEQHLQVRASLGATLRAVISQRLLPRASGAGLVPAVEVLVATGRVFDRIVDPERTHELEEVIADGEYYGMQTFDQSLLQLYAQGEITQADAIGAATHPHDLMLEIRQLDGAAVASTAPVAG
jgi:twitching motility protein PilT